VASMTGCLNVVLVRAVRDTQSGWRVLLKLLRRAGPQCDLGCAYTAFHQLM